MKREVLTKLTGRCAFAPSISTAVAKVKLYESVKAIGIEPPLRLGCGLVNLYAGFFLLTDPVRYYKYVPDWLREIANTLASVDIYLRLQDIGELMIAACLLGWFMPRWCVRIAAMLFTTEMALILVFVGIDTVTFRNMGLVGAALSLLFSSYPET